MSTLEEVIARSRAPGGFSERKRFTVARAAAVRKMRQFSLASPYFYILELVQSATANGATYIDISIERDFIGVSYVGGGFTEQELGGLFDFLFASKSDIDTADLRQLALGLNVLMLTEPELIVVESGDGTLEGTTRIDIRPRQDTVDVGKPEAALRGTFISAKGIKRKLLKRFDGADAYSYTKFPELAVLSERCLCSPVPILVNNESLHGYGAMRAPVLYGYSRVISFDEGDLYGTIGLAGPASALQNLRHLAGFKLLTWGVWVQSVEDQPSPELALGGVLNFNRLNKTADHSAIVRDERYAELWARLRPWIMQLQRGEKASAAAYNIRPLDGPPITPRELRELLRASSHIISIPPTEPQSAAAGWARQIGAALDAPVLCTGAEETDALRALGGGALRIITPNVTTPDDARFFSQPPHPVPDGAWACSPIDATPLSALELARAAGKQSDHPFADLLTRLGGALRKIPANTPLTRLLSEIPPERHSAYTQQDHYCTEQLSARVYAPLDGEQLRGVKVELVLSNRLLWEGELAHDAPGLLLRVTLPETARRVLLSQQSTRTRRPFTLHIAQAALALCAEAMELTMRRAMEGLAFHAVTPNSRAAHLAMAAIARGALWRLEQRGEQVYPELELLSAAQDKLLDLPILTTLAGQPRTMRQLTSRIEHGLIYGVRDDIPGDLEGLDTSEVLALSAAQEELLARCVGQACYVRVDERDVLAQLPGAELRDVALGLRAYPEGTPLLVEGERAGDAALTEQLAGALIEASMVELPATPLPSDLERRRQLLRHMQWCAIQSWSAGTPRFEQIGLFADQDGHMRTLAELEQACRQHGAVWMNSGVAQDMWLKRESATPPADPPRLMMNPFALLLLQRILPVRPALAASMLRGGGHGDTLLFEVVDTDQAQGRLELPVTPSASAAIGIYAPDRQRLDLYTGRWARLGVVGELTRRAEDVDVEQVIEQTCTQLFTRLLYLADSSTMEASRHERLLELIMAFVGDELRLTRDARGVTPALTSQLSQRILALPLFDTAHGRPVSGMRLVEEFCRAQLLSEPSITQLSPTLSPALRRWLDQTLVPERIHHHKPAPMPPAPEQDSAQPASPRARIEDTLNRWLERLNPATWAVPTVVLLGTRETRRDPTQGAHHEARLHQQLISASEVFRMQGSATLAQLYVRIDAEELAPLFATCLEEPTALAWLLMAIYGYVNHALEPITNAHELELHQRIAQALLDGELRA
jgi:hypothetical protein